MKKNRKIVVYCGERVGSFEKIYQLFKDKRGKEYNFKGIKRPWIGSCYAVNANDEMKTCPEIVEPGFQMSERDRLEAESQKLIVKATRLKNKKAMQLKNPHQDIVKAIKLLRRFYINLTYLDRRRFTDYLQNEMSKKG